MALSDDERLKYIVPLVVLSSTDIDADLVGLTAKLQQDAQDSFDGGMATVQPQIEAMLGHSLTPDQLREVRYLVAGKLNQALQTIRISP